jgi:hypothetical protein
MAHIFISYRRDDTGYIASMLAKELVDTFGNDSVFLDVDNIPFGVDFRTHLDHAVAKCDVLLAIVGDEFLDIKTADGTRRLDDPSDFVRIEIEAALRRGIPIIPVITEDATMPREADLPPSLKSFAFRNGAELRAGKNLRFHMESLLKGIQTIVSPSKTATMRSSNAKNHAKPDDDDVVPITDYLIEPEETTEKHHTKRTQSASTTSRAVPNNRGDSAVRSPAPKPPSKSPKPSAIIPERLDQLAMQPKRSGRTLSKSSASQLPERAMLLEILDWAFLLNRAKKGFAALFRGLFLFGFSLTTVMGILAIIGASANKDGHVMTTIAALLTLYFAVYVFAWIPAVILELFGRMNVRHENRES